jgi:anti-sigma factor RsiW
MKPVRNAGGLDCFQVLALLGDFIDGGLPAAGRDRIRQHLSACNVCESFGGVFAAAVRALRESSPAGLDADIAERLRARLARDQ